MDSSCAWACGGEGVGGFLLGERLVLWRIERLRGERLRGTGNAAGTMKCAGGAEAPSVGSFMRRVWSLNLS